MRYIRRLLVPVLILINCAVPAAFLRAAESGAPPVVLADVQAKAAAALARADLAAYRGWIKFLQFEAETASAKDAASKDTLAKTRRLAEWVVRISANPKLLATLTGVQEWAYESPVDGSGQPFKMAIPTDYDPARPAPLSVYMHGYAGNHLEHSTGMASHPGAMDLSVLGRARGGGYRTLSEADVLHVIDYVTAHWAIDPDRIHLNGGSMGGGGTYRLGARYPHRFASGRPTCGFASFVPLGNLLTFPIYATHSADDWVVSALHDRGPLARLRALGGQVIYDETNGLGHAAWDYKEGNARGAAWVPQQVRPGSRTVRHVDYTATDGGAMRGWWGEVVEWGDAPLPARFVLTAGASNLLHAELTNIRQLRLRLAESPFDPSQPLQVSVNGGVPFTLPAPLPEQVVIARGEKDWGFAKGEAAPAFRLHTPGSAALLYNGEPLLIVHGTRGSEAEIKAMRSAAEAASKSPNPVWLDDQGQAGPEGTPHSQNLYGRLAIKADTAVTEADLARCHLVLIGTAAQNTLVARMADQLPVRFTGGEIVCTDGVKFPGKGTALGLVHYNPLAPGRLVFWVASDNPAVYAANSRITQMMGGGSHIAAWLYGADLLVMDDTTSQLVATRNFDSRWRWAAGRAGSPAVPASVRTFRSLSAAMGTALRQATGADVALIGRYGPATQPAVTPSITRVSDLMAPFYNLAIGTCEMTGAELAEVARKAVGEWTPLYVEPAAGIDLAKLDRARLYRVALPVDLIWTFSGLAQLAPRSYQHTDLLVTDALERFLVNEK
jgi:hypothetical protein